MSIGFRTPSVAHTEQGAQERRWKNKIYRKNDTTNEKNVVPLSRQTNKSWVHACPALWQRLQKQHGFTTCVYRISMAKRKVSTGSVNVAKKCLVKSGKVRVIIRHPKSIALATKKHSFLQKQQTILNFLF